MNRNYKNYGHDTNRNLRLVIGLARTNTEFVRTVQQSLAKYKITLPQFGVLEALYHLGDLKIGQIIEKTLSTSGNMTVVVRNLEKEALIQRKQSLEDKRASFICLSDKGQELIEKIFPEHLEIIANQFSRLNSDDKDELSRLLKKMNGLD